MLKKNQYRETINSIIEFGDTILTTLTSKNNKTITPILEDKIDEILTKLSPEELGLLSMTCTLILSKIARCRMKDNKDNVITAVIGCRAIIDYINEIGKEFNLDYFNFAVHQALEPTFKPTAEQIMNNALSTQLEDMDPVGEC